MSRDAIARGRAAAGAVAVVALACGCTAQAVETAGEGEKSPTTRAASDNSANSSPTPSESPLKKMKSPVSRAELPQSKAPDLPSTPPPRPRTSTPPPPAPPEPGPVVLARGQDGEKVRELQARLRQIGWFGQNPTGTYGPVTATAVEGFQGKRGLLRTGATDTRTWDRLLAMTREPTRDELYPDGGMPPAEPDRRCLTGRVLCISKESRTLTWMIDGRAVTTVDVRFGSEYTPTREGAFQVFWKNRDHVSTLYDTPMPYAMFFSGGQAVHYSSDFAARGYNGTSHGCVNVRDKKGIAKLFKQVRTGDKVVVYK
ncbi:L,D-transpeptidase family protein [Streptomyces flavofungini]|uniref:L,D-transpeptidase family protein n=1 Tax=Streptomyces flavofungini TaxID=68200 RepID=UPI0025AFDD5F|nr:L,D-transpeptidase family protein [Streptomyces flavofungini]WJV46614.1 L,D-transpeptidase family protein [Streptomyces flavofungini]